MHTDTHRSESDLTEINAITHRVIGCAYRVLLELKHVENIDPVHMAQCLNYLKATGLRLGLILNFAKTELEIKRLAL